MTKVTDSTTPARHKRSLRNYIVSKRIQFIYGFLFPSLIGQIYFVSGFAASRLIQMEDLEARGFLRWPVITAAVLALLLFTFAWGTVMTFFLAGPLHAIKRHLERYAAGERPAPLKFRKYDEFKGLDDLLNLCLEKKTGDSKDSSAS